MTASTLPTDAEEAQQALLDKLDDALTPGFAAEFDPEEAQRAGAFVEDALSEVDAADSAVDLDGALAFHGSRGA